MLSGTPSRRCCAALCALALAAAAQEKPSRKSSGPTKYVNPELGIAFSGVYGWESEIAAGAGAWTQLAQYQREDLGALVRLLIRDNPYATTVELRAALEKKFPDGGEPAEGRPAFTDVSLTDVDMTKGLKLPGIQVEALKVEITEDGKKRTRKVLMRTYFGKKRLFRIHCEVRRARAKRVRDLFDRALAGLVVTAADERTTRGTPFRSARGAYRCLVPEGFTVVAVPDSWAPRDAVFESGRLGVVVTVVSYRYDGSLADLVESMVDYYEDALTVENEEAKTLGGTGFVGTITKDGNVTLVAGTVRGERAYRVHTRSTVKKEEAARRVHEAFLKTLKIGGR